RYKFIKCLLSIFEKFGFFAKFREFQHLLHAEYIQRVVIYDIHEIKFVHKSYKSTRLVYKNLPNNTELLARKTGKLNFFDFRALLAPFFVNLWLNQLF